MVNVHTTILASATPVASAANKAGKDPFMAKEVFCQAVLVLQTAVHTHSW
jgi:hypothetical protein